MANRWSKVEALLDKEVQRETRKYLAKIKAVVSGGHGNGVITAKKLAVPSRRAMKRAFDKESPTFKHLAKSSKKRQLHGRYLGLMRSLPKAEKAKLSAIYKQQGVRKAIAAAKAARKSAEA